MSYRICGEGALDLKEYAKDYIEGCAQDCIDQSKNVRFTLSLSVLLNKRLEAVSTKLNKSKIDVIRDALGVFLFALEDELGLDHCIAEQVSEKYGFTVEQSEMLIKEYEDKKIQEAKSKNE